MGAANVVTDTDETLSARKRMVDAATALALAYEAGELSRMLDRFASKGGSLRAAREKARAIRHMLEMLAGQ